MLNIFKETTTTTGAGVKQLEVTPALTTAANGNADKLVQFIMNAENGDDLVKTTFEDAAVLDALIVEHNAAPVQEFLTTADPTEIGNALKSQQSKRSRAKNGDLTMQNYKKLLVGAIAEHMIRNSCELPKSARAAGTRGTTTWVLTEEQTLIYKADQLALGKAIRNVQSKKTALKKADDFDETSEFWLQVLAYEESLKALRSNQPTVIDTELLSKAKHADEISGALSAIGDISKMKKDELAEVIKNIQEMALSII